MQIHRANAGPQGLPGAQEAKPQATEPSVREATAQRAGALSAQKVAPAAAENVPTVDQVSQKVLSRTRELTARLPQGMQQEMSHLMRNHPGKAHSILSLSNQALQSMDHSPAAERLQGLRAGLLEGLGQLTDQLGSLGRDGVASAAPSFGYGDVAEEIPEEELQTYPAENVGIYGMQDDDLSPLGPIGPGGPGGPAPGDPIAPTDIVRMMASQVIDVRDQVPSLWNEIKGISQAMQGQ